MLKALIKMHSATSSPGSQALQVASTVQDLAVFKKPFEISAKSRRYKTKILDEETYIERMGEIIERDFFPDLERLKAQNDYLDALEQNDVKRMRELYEKYSSGRPATERMSSPAGFETPQHLEPGVSSEKESGFVTSQKTMEIEKRQKLGLDGYLSTHTSEDNASFEEMMEEAEKRQRIKYAWLYEMEDKSKLLAIEANKVPTAENGKVLRPLLPDTWAYKNKNYIMYVPDGVELTAEEKIELAKRKQEVMHDNTRLVGNPFNEKQNKETIDELVKTQSRVNDGKIGVDGKEIVRNPTPRVNGFSFVATPSPSPGQCYSPLMTWGQIEGTPFRLDGGDTPLLRSTQGPSFRMAEPPKREKIALQLAEKAGERHRDRKNKALAVARRSFTTPSPRSLSTIDRLSTMSPAARRLATQKLKIVNTPTPRRTPSRTALIGVKTPTLSQRINTPNRTPKSSDNEEQSGSLILTDNLLNLPQRQRAADFFHK